MYFTRALFLRMLDEVKFVYTSVPEKTTKQRNVELIISTRWFDTYKCSSPHQPSMIFSSVATQPDRFGIILCDNKTELKNYNQIYPSERGHANVMLLHIIGSRTRSFRFFSQISNNCIKNCLEKFLIFVYYYTLIKSFK